MERYPSIKTLTEAFGAEKAKKIRDIMEGYTHSGRPGGSQMNRIDSVLGTCGVEFIPAGRGNKSPSIEYCNTGDPYHTTILRVNEQFRVGCWGDIVERGNYE